MSLSKLDWKEVEGVGCAMRTYGGGFVSALGKALLCADEHNQQRIKNGFPEYWEEYKKIWKKDLR